jgi:hypothetical protein
MMPVRPISWLAVGVLLAALGASEGRAQCLHDADLTRTEVQCQRNEGLTLGKFVGAKGKCVTACVAALRRTQASGATVDFSSCLPPFADPDLLQCLSGGAEAKAKTAIAAKCTVDTPECYGEIVSRAEMRIAQVEPLVDADIPVVYCVEAAGTNPSAANAMCEDAVAKESAKLTLAVARIMSQCRSNECAGRVAAGACEPGPDQNPVAFRGVDAAAAKAASAINRKCIDAGAKPACMAFLGPSWVNHVVTNTNYFRTSYCGSPSAAFIDD